jgi:hypothetical protein
MISHCFLIMNDGIVESSGGKVRYAFQAWQSVLRGSAIFFIVSVVLGTDGSTFVTYMSLFSRLSASVTQSQSRVARKTGHNRSRHRATPAKVSVVIL